MFKLSRYFSIASLLGIVIILVTLSLLIRHLSVQSLLENQTRSNIDLTTSFANSIWPGFKSFLEYSEALDINDLKLRPELTELQAITRKQMRGVNVVKVKIYNLEGTTVFSTEAKQIGEDKSNNSGFLQAKNGQAVSEIAFRNEFYSIEQIKMDRNLVTSYVPVRENETGPVKAVFEVYSDVTPLLKNITVVQYKMLAGILAALSVLYLFLFFIVRHADKILCQQDKERKKIEEKIRYQAYHNPLTGLPNRNSFDERIKEVFARAFRHRKKAALIYIDLDRFKLINDSLGHDAGDRLLQITAERITQNLRDMDMAFHMSGDEFIIISEDVNDPVDASVIAYRILDAMKKPVHLDNYDVLVNMSIGITCFPKPDAKIDTVLKEADTAMYRAKQGGHNNVEFFMEEHRQKPIDTLKMENDLLRAVKNSEFQLHYQPKHDANTGEILSVEALIRWPHPDKGMLGPADFVPLLEDMGEIHKVGQWVLLQACTQAKTWITQGYPAIRMSVNISAKQFRSKELVSIIEKVLLESKLDPAFLELELTESMFIGDIDAAIQTMQELKKIGVSLSIDDFGSGYSSLGYLKQFPLDYLKIDKVFISNLSSSTNDAAIIEAIMALASSLDMKVIAEGVEKQSQIDLLREKGCHELQGYFFNPPLPASEIELLLCEHARKQSGLLA